MTTSVQNDTNSLINPTLINGVESTQATSKAILPNWKNSSNALFQQQSQRNANVSMKQADQALQNIFSQFNALIDKNSNGEEGGQPSKIAMSLALMEKSSMDTMMLMATNLGLATFSNSAEAAAKSMSIQTETQIYLRNEQDKAFQEQLAKNIEAADQSKKGGIIQVVFDWAIATAEVIYGVAKVIGAVASGDVVAGAAGGAYIMAGLAGMVKATAETLILMADELGLDDKDIEKLKQVADIAGKVQLALEITAAVIDIVQAGRAISAARGATTAATKTAMTQAAPQIAEQATKVAAGTITQKVATQATKAIAENVAQQVAQQVAQTIATEMPKAVATEMAKTMAKELGKEFTEELTKELVQETIKRAVREAVEQAAEVAIKKAVEKGVVMTAQEITKVAVRNLTMNIITICMEAATSAAFTTLKGTAQGVSQITVGAIKLEVADLKEKIDQLLLKQDFLQWCYQWFDDMKKQQTKMLEDAVSKSGDTLDSGTQSIQQSGNIQAQIAASAV
ncbi:type III secretion system translocon subunit SctE [Shewanella surugensis]|uniref:Type III secretion system translocon subunit SctE n=1 Tax=Shewanella surugensis TaxID=212020 RepID=A0ABT0L7N3_9GAMM|nr:type III secretion system translocon subunit SctE [Shewanella surugensis]MCL1123697.1 type III secretion system translocon subunit SctE [Shewanella surugensis]